jgi:hypothetical protein
MKLILKLVIAALLANAVYRVGSEYLNYIKFREDVREAVIFKSKTDEELRRRIMEAANRYDVPIDDDAIAIRRQDKRIYVDGAYKKEIEVVPSFNYGWGFTLSVDAAPSTTALLIPPPPAAKPRP